VKLQQRDDLSKKKRWT